MLSSSSSLFLCLFLLWLLIPHSHLFTNKGVTLYALSQALHTSPLPSVATGTFPLPSRLEHHSAQALPGPPMFERPSYLRHHLKVNPVLLNKARLHQTERGRKSRSLVEKATHRTECWCDSKHRASRGNYVTLYHQASQTSCIGNYLGAVY